jgi:pimeloyl-ACP methyl ester carboxylesterase
MPSTIPVDYRQAQIGPAIIAYQVAGDGAPIVLIHGLSGSSRWWARTIEPLAERFRVHVVDLIGFGASRGGLHFVLDQPASYLAGWMKEIGIERAGMVGHSMGGYIAAELAADHPEQVERLVLVDAAALPFSQSIVQHGVSLIRALRHMRPSFRLLRNFRAAACYSSNNQAPRMSHRAIARSLRKSQFIGLRTVLLGISHFAHALAAWVGCHRNAQTARVGRSKVTGK